MRKMKQGIKKLMQKMAAVSLAAGILISGGISRNGILMSGNTGVLTVSASSQEGDFVYEVTNGKVIITRYVGSNTEVYFPSTLNGRQVDGIGKHVIFNADEITKVVVPEGVTFIEDYAFYESKGLREAELPDGLKTIGKSAFNYCKQLQEITIPETVSLIDEKAFIGCKSITSLVIPGSVRSLGKYAFAGCDLLKEVTFSEGLTEIGDNAFSSCPEISTITLPEGLSKIGESAFQGCAKLSEITLPNSVYSVERDAFNNTAWYSSQPDGNVYIGTIYYKYKGNMPENYKVTIRNGTTGIAMSAFSGCENLIRAEIPEGVRCIMTYAFYQCSGLTEIYIPDSVTELGSQAFYDCNSLESVRLSNRIKELNYRVFAYCKALERIDIPEGVTRIGKEAFYRCSDLNYVTLPETLLTIEDEAFYLCSLLSLKIPGSVESIGKYVFKYNDFKSVEIGYGVSEITEGMFEYCSELENIIIPNSVSVMAGRAFTSCSKLKELTIPDSVNEIGDSSFEAFDSLYLETIKGYTGSEAERKANRYKRITFISIGSARVYPNEMKLTDINTEMNLSETQSITATVEPDDAINKEVRWRSSDNNVIAVSGHDNTAVLRAVGSGVAEITARTANGVSRNVTITVKEAAKVKSFAITTKDVFKSLSDDHLVVEAVLKLDDEGGTSIEIIKNYALNAVDWRLDDDSKVKIESKVTEYSDNNRQARIKVRIKTKGTQGTAVLNAYVSGNNTFYHSELSDSTKVGFYQVDELGVLYLSDNSFLKDYEQGKSPFYNDSDIKTVVFDRACTKIGTYTFENCSSLGTIVLGRGIYLDEGRGLNIQSTAFSGCNNIKKVYGEAYNENSTYSLNISLQNTRIPQLENAAKIPDSPIFSSRDDTFTPYNAPKVSVVKSGVLSTETTVILNENIQYIAPDAIGKPGKVTIFGYPDTYAQKYAELKDYKFVDITPDSDPMDFDSEINGFSHDDFGFCGRDDTDSEIKNTYQIENREIYNKLMNAAKTIFQQSDLKKSLEKDEWIGSCFGISSTIVLAKTNRIDLKNFGNADSYYDINPASDQTYRDMINYYQKISNLKSYIPRIVSVDSENELKDELQTITELAQNIQNGGEQFMVNVQFKAENEENEEKKGHTMVACGAKKLVTNDYLLYLYDPNYSTNCKIVSPCSQGYLVMLISSDYRSVVPVFPINKMYQLDIIAVGHTLASELDPVDLDGPDNEISYVDSASHTPILAEQINDNHSVNLILKNNTSVRVSLDNEKRLQFDKGHISGNVTYQEFFNNYHSSDDHEYSYTYIEIPYSDRCEIEFLSDRVDIAVGTADCYYAFVGTGLEKVHVDFEKQLRVIGDSADCEIYVTKNDLQATLYKLDLNRFSEAFVNLNEGKVDVKIDSPQKTVVTEYWGMDQYSETVSLGEDYTDICHSFQKSGDTNGDGTADIADALMISRYDAGLIALDSTQLSVSDVNHDGSVDIADALMIARFDAGLIESLE